MQNEYVCHNLDCPANIKLKKELNCPALKEYYGKTQKEINKQKLLNQEFNKMWNNTLTIILGLSIVYVSCAFYIIYDKLIK